ncbi:MAG: OmpW/AlkL family protein [Alphaproteobacteria bacterium]
MTYGKEIVAALILGASGWLAPPAALAGDAGMARPTHGDTGWMVRGRAVGVVPDEGGTTTIGGSPEIDNSIVPELDISYFFNKNLAVELVLGTTPHKAKLKNPNVDLGKVWLLPPTLLAQYHFDDGSAFKPYVGAGLNYTIFYNEDAPGGAVTSIKYDDSVGYALQAGVDYHYKGNWYLNLDVKKLWLDTDVSVNGGAIRGKVDIDPWLIGVGIGYRY